MIKPPPIQEPWIVDQMGRLASPAWVLWLQDLANMSQLEDEFSNTLGFQTIGDADTDLISPDDLDVKLSMEVPGSSDTYDSVDDAFIFTMMNT